MDPQAARGLKQATDVPHDAGVILDQGKQFRLDIHHPECGVAWGHQEGATREIHGV